MPSAGATTNLTLPYLEAAQAQKHVTVNEGLRLLDALVQGAAISRTVTAQPGAPADGDVYILPAGKTGAAWGGMTNFAIAYYRDGVWAQITPREGWTFYVKDEDQHVVWSGAAWGPILSAAQTSGFRNRLKNAAFAFNERGAASAANDVYGFDRWYLLTSTGSVTLGALTNPETGRPTGIRLTQPDATAKRIGLAQIVESADIRDLRSLAAAMAARVRCSASQAIRMAILEHTGTADAVTSNVVNNWASTTYTPGNFFIAGVNVIAVGASTPAANTWTDLDQITGAFGASMTNAIVMVWTEGALAQNGTLDLDQVQLEPGAICGAFARRPAGEELSLCRRYYFQYGPGLERFTWGFINGTTLARFLFRFEPMRAAPVITVSAASDFQAEADVAAYTGTAATVHSIQPWSAVLDLTISGAVAGYGAILRGGAGGAKLTFDAEL